MKKYKIGITFDETMDVWSNGANQNIIYLYILLSHSKIVKEVYLLSYQSEVNNKLPIWFTQLGINIKLVCINDVLDKIDILISGSMSIEPEQALRIQQHGGKVVCYEIGNDFIMDVESVLFDRTASRLFNGVKFDSIWVLPHHAKMCHDYFSIMYRCESHIVPFIWSPIFCDKVIKQLKEELNLTFGYIPNKNQGKRIASFEPNLNVVKTSFLPILICEQAYRTDPSKIKHYYACNTYDKRNNPTFFNFIGRTDIVKKNIMTVEERYLMPDFLTRYVDIVVSHQWENGLNYAYNDALYGGYPLVHNSSFLPRGVGYYYPDFDAFEGAKVLLEVIKYHDNQHDTYVKRAKEYLTSQLPTNPINIYLYEKEIIRLFDN